MTDAPISSDPVVRFGGYAFDFESNELFRGHRRIDIQPQPARLLALFLTKPRSILSQEEITTHIWPNSVVEYEQRIRSMVKDIRTVLGDDPENARYIETVSKLGYRFISPIDNAAAETQTSLSTKTAGIIAVGTLLAFAIFGGDKPFSGRVAGADGRPQTVLAVLPVADTSEAGAGDFPVDGLTHELIVSLAQLAPNQLRVIGRISAMKYKNTSLSAPEISQSLGAGYLLETTLGRSGPVLRLTATLVEASSEQVIWSGSFNGTFGELPSIEAMIARGIGETLNLDMPAIVAVTGPRQSNDPVAREAYLMGLYILGKGTRDDRPRAAELFRQAINADPNYALAWAGLARAIHSFPGSAEYWEALDRVFQLDDGIAEAYYLRATNRFAEIWDWQGAAQDFEMAIQLQPGRTDYRLFYSAFLRAAGDFEGALVQAEISLSTDPLSELVYRDTSWLYLATNELEKAIQLCSRALALGLRNPSQDHECLMYAYIKMDDLERAAGAAREIIALDGDGELAVALADSSPAEQMQAFWTWRLAQLEADQDHKNHFGMAGSLSMLGRLDDAMAELDKGIEAREFGMVFLLGDPKFDPLRGDPRFQSILQSVGMPFISGQS